MNANAPILPAASAPIELYSRCGRPTEESTTSNRDGQDLDRMPLCIACLATCINDPGAFSERMAGRE